MPRPSKSTVDSVAPSDGKEEEEEKQNRAGITQLVDSRVKKPHAIGCCPRGDPKGKVFRDGSSCCVDQIFNTSTHMCCSQKKIVLDLSKESLHYCYGIACRMEDLELESKRPMRASCTHSKLGSPTNCLFTCPPGSQIRGIKKTKCAGGEWTASPECCEGCPSTHRHDVTFVVDVNADAGVGGQAHVRSLIRSLVAYLPVSQIGVRVGVTSFGDSVMSDERSWPLVAHESHQQLNAAIDNLQADAASKRNAGAALRHVTQHAFTAAYGDRKHVDDVIVYIATGDPSDEVAEVAAELTERSTFVVISAGAGGALREVEADHKIHADSLADLHVHKKFLYHTFCGSQCLNL